MSDVLPPDAWSDGSVSAELGDHGVDVSGPPWILGWRGAPLDAPENTLTSFRRALRAGLDGIHYDVRACASGDPVVLRDATLERTSGAHGLLRECGLTELFHLEVGSWFSKDFVGEPLPHLDEVLELEESPESAPLHLLELHEAALVPELLDRVRQFEHPQQLRVASTRRDVCLELRDGGVSSVLICPSAEEKELAFLRDERLTGLAVTTPRGWETSAGRGTWPCERWVLGIDEPQDLERVMRSGVHALTSTEGRRALAIRTLVKLTRAGPGGYPIECGPLPIATSSDGPTTGEWRGEWYPTVRVTNPFAFACRVSSQLFVRRGVFECEGLPVAHELDAGECIDLRFGLRGGSWSPGGDPLVAALFEWPAQADRPAGRLLLDAPLRRRRFAVADVITQRLEMLRERPRQGRASMTIMRRGAQLVVAVENDGGLKGVRIVVSIDDRMYYGAGRIRVPLPREFDSLASGVPFSCGFYGRAHADEPETLRRWAGGVPADPGQGGAGCLLARIQM